MKDIFPGSEMVKKLKEYLNSITDEQFDKEWAEIEAMNFQGPTVEEFTSGPEWDKVKEIINK